MDENMSKFLKEAVKDLKNGEWKTFTCPICGEEAIATITAYNGHLHARCNGCGTRLMQ